MLTDPCWGENENLVGECMGRNQTMIRPFVEHDEEVLIKKVIPFEPESGTLAVFKQRGYCPCSELAGQLLQVKSCMTPLAQC